jgi:hypothetical protein
VFQKAQKIARNKVSKLPDTIELDFPQVMVENEEIVSRIESIMNKRTLVGSIKDFICRSI